MKKTFIILMIGTLMLTLNSCKSFCIPGTTPKGLITEREASNLEANYLIKQEKIKKESAIFTEEPRDFFWTIEELESYICYAKEEAAKKGKIVSGFRIYLGAKPLEKTPTQVGLNTIFMVPTEKKVVNSSLRSSLVAPDNIINDTDANVNIDGISLLDYAGAGNPPKAFNTNLEE